MMKRDLGPLRLSRAATKSPGPALALPLDAIRKPYALCRLLFTLPPEDESIR